MVLSLLVVMELKHVGLQVALPISLSIAVRIMTQTGAPLLNHRTYSDLQLSHPSLGPQKVYFLGTERHV